MGSCLSVHIAENSPQQQDMSMLNKQAVILMNEKQLEIREGPTATKYLIRDMWMVGHDEKQLYFSIDQDPKKKISYTFRTEHEARFFVDIILFMQADNCLNPATLSEVATPDYTLILHRNAKDH